MIICTIIRNQKPFNLVQELTQVMVYDRG